MVRYFGAVYGIRLISARNYFTSVAVAVIFSHDTPDGFLLLDDGVWKDYLHTLEFRKRDVELSYG